MTATRRLAAILAANVAGYSWLMGTWEIVVPGRHANGLMVQRTSINASPAATSRSISDSKGISHL
jgi:hypothetical protein